MLRHKLCVFHKGFAATTTVNSTVISSCTLHVHCGFLFYQPSSQVGKTKISPTSDEYVLDQLSVCEEKLLKVLEDLDATGKDLGEINKQMAEEEVRTCTRAAVCV